VPLCHRLFLLLIVAAAGIFAAAAAPPNVLVVLADDQGWGDLSLHGNPNLATPNIDSLARDGAEVRHFYVCAVCSPTRAEFLTGRYHRRMGVSGTSVGKERFSANEETIAEVFRRAGYATAAYGKWHSGTQWPYHPNARGFDDFCGFCSGHWADYFNPMLEHNGQVVRGNGYVTDDFTDQAIEFISRHRDQPWFVYLPYNIPHSPMQVPQEFWDRFKEKSIEPDPREENARRQDLVHTRAALAMCENIDFNVGRLLSHLAASGLADNTIVVYFSDNGPNGYRFNGGMRGRKGSTFEGGLRSPLLIRYPAAIPAGLRVTQVAAAIDLLPTLTKLAGVVSEPPQPLDGRSIASLLQGEAVSWSDRRIFSTWNRRHSVRTARWRMHHSGELFDIATDPGETVDVAGEYPEVARELTGALDQYLAETQLEQPGKIDKRPFSLGHPDAVYTHLPARDATFGGGIQRSNRHPNCTFLTDWTRTGDQINWNVEVLDDGEFEVYMYYASAGVGTQLMLRFGDASIAATITDANDVPLTGMARDRYPRQEGYTKHWKPMRLGRMNLRRGRGTLTLRATKVAGDRVADMRLLVFQRVGW